MTMADREVTVRYTTSLRVPEILITSLRESLAD